MNLYQGTFNWYRELHVLWTNAKDKERAFNNFIQQLGEKLDRKRRHLLLYFLDEDRDNWKVVRR